MAVLNKEDYMSRIQTVIGEDTSDDALAFIEDMTDTFNDMETRSSANDSSEWENKYNELDKAWREKYRARFFEGGITPAEIKKEQEDDVKDDGDVKSFDDLFEEREG